MGHTIFRDNVGMVTWAIGPCFSKQYQGGGNGRAQGTHGLPKGIQLVIAMVLGNGVLWMVYHPICDGHTPYRSDYRLVGGQVHGYIMW